MFKPRFLMTVSAMAALSFPAVAAAQQAATADVTEAAPDEIPPGWRFELQPFAWLPVNVRGDASVLNREVPFDVSGEDILDSLEVAASLRFEAWQGHYGLVLDGMYARLGKERTVGPVPFEITSRTFVGDVMGAYRVGPGPLGPDGAMMLDVFAGIRVTNLSQELEIAGLDLDADETEVKGVGALRGLLRLNRTWVIGARALAAGPDLTWTVGAGFEADFWILALKFGYLFEDVSAESDKLSMDTVAHGPYLGVGFRFGSGLIY